MNTILKHYLYGIVLAILVFGFSTFVQSLPIPGYGALGYMYAFTLGAQVTYYWLTSTNHLKHAILNFILNFFLWITELVQLEHLLDGTGIHRIIYRSDELYVLRSLLGGILWASNKLLIDKFVPFVSTHRKSEHERP